MTRVLVTGGNGGLGRALTPRLQAAGYTVRVVSRQPRPAAAVGLEWVQADVEQETGLAEALSGVEVVVNAVSSPMTRTQQVDVEGTRRVLAASRAAGVAHLIHVSIVGIERVPYPYYQHKVAAEAVVRAGGVPYSILRATQFHSLLDRFLGAAARLPILMQFQGFQFQLIDEREVAQRLCELVGEAPAGLLPDVGGPLVQRIEELVPLWLQARGLQRPVLYLPLPGRVGHSFRQGYNTCPEQRQGRITWAEWLTERYGPRPVAQEGITA